MPKWWVSSVSPNRRSATQDTEETTAPTLPSEVHVYLMLLSLSTWPIISLRDDASFLQYREFHFYFNESRRGVAKAPGVWRHQHTLTRKPADYHGGAHLTRPVVCTCATVVQAPHPSVFQSS